MMLLWTIKRTVDRGGMSLEQDLGLHPFLSDNPIHQKLVAGSRGGALARGY